jgi:hypothetical protein
VVALGEEKNTHTHTHTNFVLNVFIFKMFTTHELIRGGDWCVLGYDVVSLEGASIPKELAASLFEVESLATIYQSKPRHIPFW